MMSREMGYINWFKTGRTGDLEIIAISNPNKSERMLGLPYYI